jgi:hypothetical protein
MLDSHLYHPNPRAAKEQFLKKGGHLITALRVSIQDTNTPES